jgi:hypothetical protein
MSYKFKGVMFWPGLDLKALAFGYGFGRRKTRTGPKASILTSLRPQYQCQKKPLVYGQNIPNYEGSAMRLTNGTVASAPEFKHNKVSNAWIDRGWVESKALFATNATLTRQRRGNAPKSLPSRFVLSNPNCKV